MKRFASLVVAALVLASPAVAAKKPTKPSSGKGSKACRNRIINQWEGTGKIATTFAPACYRLALDYVKGHSDIQEYSSLGDDIKLALQAALERQRGEKVPAKVGKHYGKTPSNVGFTTSTTAVPTKNPPKGPKGPSNAVGPTDSSSGSGLPIPVIILGGLAIVLVAAGAIGAGIRARRR